MKNKTENRSVLHFNRWGNKSFSAFSSLQRVVKVCVLSAAYFTSLGLPSIIAQSEENSHREIDLEEVEVSAEANVAALESELTRIIAVVSKTEIERSSAQSLNQLLKGIPGIDIRQRGAHSTQADLSIRAGSFEQVLILLNGINISDPHTGHNNLNIPISLNAIERIEILEGAGLRYNTEGAFAGAINIVTKADYENAMEIDLAYGEHSFINSDASIRYHQGNFNHALNLNYSSSDGYRENTDFESKRFFYQSGFKHKNTKADFQLGYVDNAFGSNSFYSFTYPKQFEKASNILTSIKVTTGDKVKISPKLYYKKGFDRWELFRDNEDAASWYQQHYYHQTDVLGGGLDMNSFTTLGRTSLGLDLRNERIRSTTLGEDLDSPIQHPLEDSIDYTKGQERLNLNAFMNHTYYWQDLVVSGNILVNYNGMTKKIKPYFGIDLAYKLNPRVTIKSSANESFRMPSYTELYFSGPNNQAFGDLTQEKALTFDFGMDYKTELITAKASVFHRRGKDIIDWVKKDTAQAKWETMNYSEVNTTGFEISAVMKPQVLNDNYAFIENLRMSFTYNNSQLIGQEYISYYALDYLKFKFTVAVDFKIYKQLTASLLANYQQRENPTTESALYDPFWLCDASIRWESKHIAPYIEISNMFDQTFYDYTQIPQAGRWAIGGVKIRF